MSDTDPAPQYSMTICSAKTAVDVSGCSNRMCNETYPEVGILEVAAVVFDNVGTVALLHDADFFDNLLRRCSFRVQRECTTAMHGVARTWRSESIGTCLMAKMRALSLCSALKTDP
jgi:hypothetical protein